MGIYAKTAVDTWTEIGGCEPCEPGLPGLGGWAAVTEVKGKGTKYEYTTDGMEWSAFEFTGNGSFIIGPDDGLVDFLLVASSSRASGSSGGKGGAVIAGLEMIEAGSTTTVTVGKTANSVANTSVPSSLTHADGEVLWAGDVGGWSDPYAGGNGGIDPNGTGVYSSIFGPTRHNGYGGGAQPNGYPYGVDPAVPNSGAGSTDTSQAWPGGEPRNQGVVGIRVPKSSDLSGLPAGAFDEPVTLAPGLEGAGPEVPEAPETEQAASFRYDFDKESTEDGGTQNSMSGLQVSKTDLDGQSMIDPTLWWQMRMLFGDEDETVRLTDVQEFPNEWKFIFVPWVDSMMDPLNGEVVVSEVVVPPAPGELLKEKFAYSNQTPTEGTLYCSYYVTMNPVDGERWEAALPLGGDMTVSVIGSEDSYTKRYTGLKGIDKTDTKWKLQFVSHEGASRNGSAYKYAAVGYEAGMMPDDV